MSSLHFLSHLSLAVLEANGDVVLVSAWCWRSNVTARVTVLTEATRHLHSASKIRADLICSSVSREANVFPTLRCAMVPKIAKMQAMKGLQCVVVTLHLLLAPHNLPNIPHFPHRLHFHNSRAQLDLQ